MPICTAFSSTTIAIVIALSALAAIIIAIAILTRLHAFGFHHEKVFVNLKRIYHLLLLIQEEVKKRVVFLHFDIADGDRAVACSIVYER